MDWKSQLPEWQQKRLSRLVHLYTADSVPTWGKIAEMGTFRDTDVSSDSGLKLVPFVRRADTHHSKGNTAAGMPRRASSERSSPGSGEITWERMP